MKSIPLKPFIWFLALAAITVVSCTKNRLYDETFTIPGGKWNLKHPAFFEVSIADTNQPQNVFLSIRNAPDYPFSNLYFFIHTHYPDGKISNDTIELTLADYDGRWLGKGMGSVKFSLFLLKKNVHFSTPGLYRFEFIQAMRMNDLQGITDIGFRIEHPEQE